MSTSTAVASPAAASVGSGWRVVARASAALDIAIAPSRTSVWAFGSRFLPGGVGQAAVIPSGLHWNGHRWTRVTFPGSVKSGIGCAGASSAGNVWAFAGTTLNGSFAQYAGALHLANGRWQVSKVFRPFGLVSGCSVLGNGNAWLFGLTHVSPGVGTWRLRGRAWSKVQTGKFFLITASEVRPDDVWAIASNSLGSDRIVAHFNGRGWANQGGLATVLPGLGTKVDLALQTIPAVGHNNVWLAGEVFPMTGGGGPSNIVLHFLNGKWHKVAVGSAGYYLPSAVPDGHGGWWALSPFGFSTGRYVFHEAKGKTRWTRIALPVPRGNKADVIELAHVPGSTAMIALMGTFRANTALNTEVLAFGTLPS